MKDHLKKALVFLLLAILVAYSGCSTAETNIERRRLVVCVLETPEPHNIKCVDAQYNLYILPKSNDIIVGDGVSLEPDEIVVVDFELDGQQPTRTVSVEKFYLDASVHSYDESEHALVVGSYALGEMTLILPEEVDGAQYVNKIMRFQIEKIEEYEFWHKAKVVDSSDVEAIRGEIAESNHNGLTLRVLGRIVESPLYGPFVQEEVDVETLRVQIDDNTIHFSELNPGSTILVILPKSYTLGQKEPVNALAIWDELG